MAEKFPLMTYVTGILARLNANSRKPTAYLYNGIRLPALPEWDREKYPYAVIHEVAPYGYDAYALTKQSYLLREMSNGNEWLWLNGTSPYLRTIYDPNKDFGWNDLSGTEGWREIDSSLSVAVGYKGEATKPFVWSNHDVLENDGTIYFAKCDEPIPVFE